MLTRRSRFGGFPELHRLREEVERAFNQSSGSSLASPVTYPALNVWESDEEIFVEAEVPGLEPSELEIFVNGGDQLTIQGERKQPNGDKGIWHRQECGYGKFSRLVQLPSDVDAAGVNARFSDGVLTITLPKHEEAKPRRIEVRAN